MGQGSRQCACASTGRRTPMGRRRRLIESAGTGLSPTCASSASATTRTAPRLVSAHQGMARLDVAESSVLSAPESMGFWPASLPPKVGVCDGDGPPPDDSRRQRRHPWRRAPWHTDSSRRAPWGPRTSSQESLRYHRKRGGVTMSDSGRERCALRSHFTWYAQMSDVRLSQTFCGFRV